MPARVAMKTPGAVDTGASNNAIAVKLCEVSSPLALVPSGIQDHS